MNSSDMTKKKQYFMKINLTFLGDQLKSREKMS